jgi:hypothetical protein
VKKKDFDKLVASIKQAGKIKHGKLKPARVFHFKPADIKAVREKLNVSQSEFALMTLHATQPQCYTPPLNLADCTGGRIEVQWTRQSRSPDRW